MELSERQKAGVEVVDKWARGLWSRVGNPFVEGRSVTWEAKSESQSADLVVTLEVLGGSEGVLYSKLAAAGQLVADNSECREILVGIVAGGPPTVDCQPAN